MFYLTVWDVETGKGAWNSPVKPVLGSGVPKGMVFEPFQTYVGFKSIHELQQCSRASTGIEKRQ